VVAQESETSELRIDRSFVVQGTVFEVEYKVGGDAISMRHLDEVAVGQSFALQRPQHKKAMDQALSVAHRNLPVGRLARKEEYSPHQHEAERL
jgi:hypothetical protein